MVRGYTCAPEPRRAGHPPPWPGSEHLVVGKEGFPGGERAWKAPRGRGPGTHTPLLLWVPVHFCATFLTVSNSATSLCPGGPPCSPWRAFGHPSSNSLQHRILGCRAPAGVRPGVMGLCWCCCFPAPLAAALALDVGSEQREGVGGRPLAERKARGQVCGACPAHARPWGHRVNAVLQVPRSIFQTVLFWMLGRGIWVSGCAGPRSHLQGDL